ncbi:CDP-glycerol glycerophosphotransferase family protein [Clostridium chromiireducens]|uniref:CDP-glycerol:poly(Glycerophosphate) glycerophosphotransferase n=1 Tax=Clostridium chromiireducens TaxID=225345 RepID=A0A1V4IXH1_9CLOT|nr:CDP-glycerol glycerophosphotransferase family protein [Clostridium chromiireducens]OPJ64520.1 CDP-glycerol:poly(glycerophosphate) glycerophosphotransferase [Clostridium chromiireducens]
MRKYHRDQLLELVSTLHKAHKEIKKQIENHNYERVKEMLIECQEAAIHIGNSIEKSEGEGLAVITSIEEYCEAVYQVSLTVESSVNANKDYRLLNKHMIKIQTGIQNEIKLKREIVFLPYKASMWDSLESIWLEAKEDPNCECYVIPIPYFDRTSGGGFDGMHYEGDMMPGYVPITNYLEYDLRVRKPDIIYFHNPYDQHNYVTSVHPSFYSSELKKYTDMLVFVPYFIAGNQFNSYDEAKRDMYHATSGVVNADYVIAQSEVWAKAVSSCGIPLSKFLILGSPKIDAVLNSLKNYREMPEEWKEYLEGKKVFLINTSIASTLSPNKNIIKMIQIIISKILSNDKCAVIWRPHPLLRETLSAIRPEYMDVFNELVEHVSNHKRAVYDISSDMHTAFTFSDALISDTSSVLKLYIVTEKPVLDIILTDEPKKYLTLDWLGVYHYYEGLSVEKFIDIVINVNDYKKDERLSRMKNSVANCDGTSGLHIHKVILEKLLKKGV